MFDTRNFATGGLYPGLVSTFSVASLGHLEIQVIIEPVFPEGGGAAGPGILRPRKDKYKVKIIVRRKGKTWKYETTVSSITANVVAKFAGLVLKQPAVVVENVVAKVQTVEEPTIRVIKK